MASISKQLRKHGIDPNSVGADETEASRLRRVFSLPEVPCEIDPDGSRRIRFDSKDSQLTLTPSGDLVAVLADFPQDRFDLDARLVEARTTSKAANQLTKMRLWKAVEAGLREAHVIGKPQKPATLQEWQQQNDEEAQKLHRQIDILGLTAEKSHELSALAFEPALLADFRKREQPFGIAVASFFAAETIRAHILAEAAKRITRKGIFDAGERDRYLARRERLSSRAGELYAIARDRFNQAGATLLAARCDELASQYAVSTASTRQAASVPQVGIKPNLEALSLKREAESIQKLIEAGDATLLNTVRAINSVADAKTQSSLAAHFVAHVVAIAKSLKTPAEVIQLLRKLQQASQQVAEDSFLNGVRLARCRGLILRERPDVLPLVGKKSVPEEKRPS